MEKSLWTENLNEKALPSLEKDITCDILIVGGGIAGLSTAFKLKDEKYDIVLIDKGMVGFGVTSKTTGKLTYMQGDIYSKIENVYNFDVAKKYLESQMYAIDIVKNIIKKHNIDCDFEEVNSYVFADKSDKLDKERKFLEKVKLEFYNKNNLPIDFPCKDAFYTTCAAVFHPLKYLMKIKDILKKSNIKIYENTTAIDLDIMDNKYVIKTKNGTIKSTKVIICTHYPFFIIPGLMPFKLHQERSYVVVGQSDNKKFSAISIDNPPYSLRYHNDYLILGGYSHHLSDKLDYKISQDKLIEAYKNIFGGEILYSWQVHDNMTTDYIPFIGKLNKKHPNLLIATGFNKWGMTNGILAGDILGDIVLNKYNKYQKLFDPSRPINFNKVINSIVNNFKIGKTYIGTKIIKPKMKEAFITTIDGKRCGVYIDNEGEKHIVRNICPHFKCDLVFNSASKTWDCPCHGSRFDIDGNLLEGPSVFPIKYEDTTYKL